MARKPSTSSRLARVIHTKDGVMLRTRDDAPRRYVVALPDRRSRYNAWQFAARLLLDAEQLTRQVEYALMLDGHRRFR